MANKHHKLRHLIHVDPIAAGKEILRAVREAKGNKGAAADILGCRHGTMLSWIEKAGVGDAVEKLVAELKEKGICVQASSGREGPRAFEVVDRKTGLPIGRGGFTTMEAASAKAAENPKRWRAQKKPSPAERQARSRKKAA